MFKKKWEEHEEPLQEAANLVRKHVQQNPLVCKKVQSAERVHESGCSF